MESERIQVALAHLETQAHRFPCDGGKVRVVLPSHPPLDRVADDGLAILHAEPRQCLARSVLDLDPQRAGCPGAEVHEQGITCEDQGLRQQFAAVGAGVHGDEAVGPQGVAIAAYYVIDGHLLGACRHDIQCYVVRPLFPSCRIQAWPDEGLLEGALI